MFQNELVNPSFEDASGWTFVQNCDIQGASYQALNPRTGVRSLRIQSRFQSIGPTTTCGEVQQSVVLVPGALYVFGVWFRSSGVFPDTLAVVAVGDGFFISQVSWSSNTSVYQLKVGVFIPTFSTGLFSIRQDPGTNNILQSRFFDDAFVQRVEDLGDAAMITQSIRAGIVPDQVLQMLGVTEGRITGRLEGLATYGTLDSLAARGRMSKP